MTTGDIVEECTVYDRILLAQEEMITLGTEWGCKQVAKLQRDDEDLKLEYGDAVDGADSRWRLSSVASKLTILNSNPDWS